MKNYYWGKKRKQHIFLDRIKKIGKFLFFLQLNMKQDSIYQQEKEKKEKRKRGWKNTRAIKKKKTIEENDLWRYRKNNYILTLLHDSHKDFLLRF